MKRAKKASADKIRRIMTAKYSKLAAFAGVFGVIGISLLLVTKAATPTANIDVGSTSQISSPATAVSDSSASGGSAVKFALATGGGTANCSGAANTPDGADPWGGCFPGLSNTGPNNPSVTTPATLTTYTGPCTFTTPNVVIENKIINCDALLIKNGGGGLTIKNSRLVSGFVDNTEQPNNGRQVTIIDSEIHGGTWIGGTVWGSYITVIRSEVTGGQHNVHCEQNCTVTDSYLHDQYGFVRNGDESHNNGFLSNGGANHVLRHNSVYCNANCSADINLNSDGNQTNDLVERNLLVAAPKAASCLYAVVTPGDGTKFPVY